jgi:PilZ domain
MAANPAEHAAPMPEFSQISLRALKLRPGMFLQSQRMEKNSPTYEAQFLGVIEDKCLMVVPVGTFSIKTGMKAGDTFIIRGFTGQYDFYFTSKVIQAFDFTFREPCYAYAVLSWPEMVEARKVRTSLRIRTSLQATLTGVASREVQPVTILDLSADGALIRSDDTAGAIGDLVSLEFSMGDDGVLSYVVAVARICHIHVGDEGCLSGLLFETIAPSDRMLIREFVVSNAD